jgi:hypothetical protein
MGNPDANQAIVEALERLSGGNFKKHWKGGPIASIATMVQLGHYPDADGKNRDIRDVSYVPVASQFLATDPEMVRQWSDAMSAPFPDINIRLATRRRIIEGLLQTQVTYTGYAYRVVFRNEFLVAAAAALGEGGLMMTATSPFVQTDTARYAAQPLMFDPNAFVAPLYMAQGGVQQGQGQVFMYQNQRWNANMGR